MSEYLGSLFLATKESRESVAQLVCSAIGGRIGSMFSIETAALDISVRQNPDREHSKTFPILVELALQKGCEEEGKNDVRKILNALKAHNLDFEASPDEMEL